MGKFLKQTFIRPFTDYIASFRKLVLWQPAVFIIIAIAFIFLLSLLLNALTASFDPQALSAGLMVGENLTPEQMAQVKEAYRQVMGILALFLIYIVLSLIAWFFAYYLFTKTLHKAKFFWKNALSFLGMSLGMFVAVIIIIFLAMLVIKQEAMTVIIILALFLLLHLHAVFTFGFTTANLGKNLKRIGSVGFGELHRFILPYLIILLTLVVASLPFSLLANFVPALNVLILIPVTLWLAWAGNYLHLLLK
ncbi:MAG: hypothetical protein V1735_00825 [Nanoarchaeota archaeon]